MLHDVGIGLNANDGTGRSANGGLVATDGVQSGAVTRVLRLHAAVERLRRDERPVERPVRGSLADQLLLGPRPRQRHPAGRTRLTGLPGSRRLTLALGFGESTDSAAATAAASLRGGFVAAAEAYRAGWHAYLAGLSATPTSARPWQTTYNVSAMVLAASEDKTFRGGFVAAPGRPWAWANELQFLARVPRGVVA